MYAWISTKSINVIKKYIYKQQQIQEQFLRNLILTFPLTITTAIIIIRFSISAVGMIQQIFSHFSFSNTWHDKTLFDAQFCIQCEDSQKSDRVTLNRKMFPLSIENIQRLVTFTSVPEENHELHSAAAIQQISVI